MLSNRKNHDLIEDALSKQLFVGESIRFSFEQLKVAFDWLQIFSNCHGWNIFDTWLDEMKMTVWEGKRGIGKGFVWTLLFLSFSRFRARVGILLQVRCEEVTRWRRMITRGWFGKTLKMHKSTWLLMHQVSGLEVPYQSERMLCNESCLTGNREKWQCKKKRESPLKILYHDWN